MGPIEGVRVIDMTTVMMGPYATQVLGDLGADVIKVETLAGDANRTIGPGRSSHMGGTVLNLHRNKRSIAIDLKQPAGRDALLAIARGADVLVHNIRPQAIARLGLAYEDVRGVNPRIIYCGAGGYATDGPYGGRPAYDDLIQGASGLAALIGRVSGTPGYVPAVVCDKVTGLAIVYAVLGALYHRERTGEGQAIEVPMFETMVGFNLVEHIRGRAFEPPLGEAAYARLLTRFRRPFPTRDSYLCLLPYTDRHWRDFFQLAGRPDLAKDPRFTSLASRTEHIAELYEIVEKTMPTRTTAEWLELCERANIAAMPVMDLNDMWDDPHLAATGFFTVEEHPSEGRYWRVGPSARFSKTPLGLTRHAPLVGEHTVELLREAGYTEAQIDTMLAERVVGDVRTAGDDGSEPMP